MGLYSTEKFKFSKVVSETVFHMTNVIYHNKTLIFTGLLFEASFYHVVKERGWWTGDRGRPSSHMNPRVDNSILEKIW